MKPTDRMSDTARPGASRGLPDPALAAGESVEAPARRPLPPEPDGGWVVRFAPRTFPKPGRAPYAPTGDDDDPGPTAA